MKHIGRIFSLVNILFAFISLIVSVLVFILFYNYLPQLNWLYQSDKILSLVVMFLLTFLLAKLLRYGFIVILLILGGWLGFEFYNGHQDMLSFYNDSRNVFNDLTMRKGKETFEYKSYTSFYRDREVVKAIDHTSPAVRAFAINATGEFFKKEQRVERDDIRTLIQSLAVFKKINGNWNYVSDPVDGEYFARASESASLLAGDCDDYSILMAAAIKSIGGRVRLTFIKGHIYPELFIGSDAEMESTAAATFQKRFKKETKSKQLHYYKDDKGNAWLNLDYTANYPGGVYMGEDIVQYIYP